MSLLLDALKKAAQEKQNADSADIKAEADAGLALDQDIDSTPPAIQSTLDDPLVLEELELDDEALSLSDVMQNGTSPDHKKKSSVTFQEHRITATPSNVTDEALQLLINKTNYKYKISRAMTWGGVVIGAMILLSVSGVYYYFNMFNDIESMQRKHQIALANLKSKTKIEENLTSLAVAPEVEKQKKSSNMPAAKTGKTADAFSNNASKYNASQQAAQTYSMQRAEKRDPVSAALELGWLAFQNKDYESSSREYKKALDKEPNNHDALLGVAAISLQQDNVESARDIYIKLLELDPRDPHAHAGLANIAQTGGANLSETKLKQLIEYRPHDAHLQFALGNLYVQKKSWPAAQQAFFNAWKSDSKNPDYTYNLAVSLDQLGKHKEAKNYYEDSLRLAAGKNISFSPDAVKSRLAYLGAIQ
jgi:Flp pilus assembly protein TadD